MSIEEKYDEVKELILMGKERGYLLYDEVNDLLPEGICLCLAYALTSFRSCHERFVGRRCGREFGATPCSGQAYGL